MVGTRLQNYIACFVEGLLIGIFYEASQKIGRPADPASVLRDATIAFCNAMQPFTNSSVCISDVNFFYTVLIVVLLIALVLTILKTKNKAFGLVLFFAGIVVPVFLVTVIGI
jgi:hypothetical protein